MDLVVLGDVIREIRQKQTKLSQEELADLIGLERTYISKIESGKKNITIETLALICNGLKISISDFFLIYDKKIITK